jgi:uncharacterized protein (DUF2147 family)
MKTIGLAAILALTSTAAFAGSFQFSIDAGTARIDFDENCTDRLCASVSWQEQGSREPTKYRLPEISTETISKFFDGAKPHRDSAPADDDEEAAKPSSKPIAGKDDNPASSSQAGREPPAQAAAEPAPASESDPAPTAKRDPAPESAKVANAAPQSAANTAAKRSRRTPVGEWLVEDGEGKIRIEECGANMCGYVSAAKNPNEKDRNNPDPALRNRPAIGTPILINMKPDGKRWSGRIYNMKDGRSYTAHIALKNANTLRVEGCAFGGMICGGQTWTRVN